MEKLKNQNKKTPKNGQKAISINLIPNTKSPNKSSKFKKSNLNSPANKLEVETPNKFYSENLYEFSDNSSDDNENEDEEKEGKLSDDNNKSFSVKEKNYEAKNKSFKNKIYINSSVESVKKDNTIIDKIIQDENNLDNKSVNYSFHESVRSLNKKILLNKTKATDLSIELPSTTREHKEYYSPAKIVSAKSIKKKLIAITSNSSSINKSSKTKEIHKANDIENNAIKQNTNKNIHQQIKLNNKIKKNNNSKTVKIQQSKKLVSPKKIKSKINVAVKDSSITNPNTHLNIADTIKNYNFYTNDYLFEFKFLEKNKKIFNHIPSEANISLMNSHSFTNSYTNKEQKVMLTCSPTNSLFKKLLFNSNEKADLNNFECANAKNNSKAQANLNLYEDSSLNNKDLNNFNTTKNPFYIKSLFKSKLETLFVLNLNNAIFKNPNYEKYLSNLNQFQSFFLQKQISDANQILLVKAYKDAPKCILVPIEHSACKFSKNIKKCNLIWKLYKFEKMVNLIKTLGPNQKYNHFPKTFQLGRKDNLWKNFKKFKRKFPNEYNYHPQAFIIPEELSEFKQFAKANPSFTWIIKPLASSRGRGIRLLTSFEDITKECLICRYIEKPHLINNKKYDLRIYVLITSFTPLKIFLFKDGLVRFASEEYTKGNKENIFIHLTNYAVNKKNVNYEKTDDDGSGSKWTLTAYEKFFAENNLQEKLQFIWERIKDIVIKTVISAAEESANYSKVYSKHENVLFELYGFDIIIDSDFNPWLLEVNVNSSLNCDSDLDYNVKTNLITDVINIIGLRPLEDESVDLLNNKGNVNSLSLRKSMSNLVNCNGKFNTNNNSGSNNNANNNFNNKEYSKSKNKSNFYGSNSKGKNRNHNNNNININNNNSEQKAVSNFNSNNNYLPVINKNNSNLNNIESMNNKNNIYSNKIIGSGQSPSISQVRIENKRNFMSEEPDYTFNYSEEIVKNYYQSFLKTYEDEYFRSKFTNFDCIFPLSFNCKNYVKFFKSYDDESIALWKWIISKKPVDKFD